MCHEQRFPIGSVVRQKHDEQRGVVVGLDAAFMGTDEWYERQISRADREGPWYHVLIHGGKRSSYVAGEDLEPDTSGEQVVHPLVNGFFKSFCEGRYQA
jgi:heat shock protein HspQ